MRIPALALACLLALAACGSDRQASSPDASGTTTTAPESTSAAATAPAPSPERYCAGLKEFSAAVAAKDNKKLVATLDVIIANAPAEIRPEWEAAQKAFKAADAGDDTALSRLPQRSPALGASVDACLKTR